MIERKTLLEAAIANRPVQISVREWRAPKPKGLVICLHGFGVSGAEFAPMAERLNTLGYNAIAPDWIGHGDSEYFGDPQAYSWDSYAKCLTAVIRRYHEPMTHYVGTSWGGGILLLFLLSHKLGPQSAVLVDVPLKSSEKLAAHQAIFDAQQGMTFPTVAAANEFLQKQRPEFARVPARFKAYFDNERFANNDGIISFKFDPAILPAYATTVTAIFDRVKALTRLRNDTLFLYGLNSPYRSLSDFMTICARMPHIRYRDDLPGGHPPTLLHKEQFGLVVDFIRRSAGS